MEQSGADPVADAIAEMTAIYERVAAQLETLTPRESFTQATRLRDELELLRMRTAKLRASKADLIRESEGLALSELADSINLSKAQADNLVRMAQGRHVPGPVRGKRNPAARGPGNPDTPWPAETD